MVWGCLGTRGGKKVIQETLMGPKHLKGTDHPAPKFSPVANQTLEASDQWRDHKVRLLLSEHALDSDRAEATAANLAAREVLQRQHKSRLSTS